MKSMTRKAALTLALMLLFALAMPALAQWPADGVIFPITDKSQYDLEVGTSLDGKERAPIGTAKTWMDVSINDNGSVIMKRSADCIDSVGWPSITSRDIALEEVPLIDLAATPYLYYDFVAENSEWMLSIALDGLSMKLAKEICRVEGTANLETVDHDGPAGTYKGRIDLSAYLDTGVVTGLKGGTKVDFTAFTFFVVDPSSKGSVTVNAIYFGGENDGDKFGGTISTDNKPTPATTNAPTTSNPASGDPGVAMLVMTGLVGLAGTGLLAKKRK